MRKPCVLLASVLIAFFVTPLPAVAETGTTNVTLSMAETASGATNRETGEKVTERVRLDGPSGHDAYQTGLASPIVTVAAGSALALGAASAALALSERSVGNEVA